MYKSAILFLSFFCTLSALSQKISGPVLPYKEGIHTRGIEKDWLIDDTESKSAVLYNESKSELTLSNGIISRTFRLQPNAATISIKKLKQNEELIRAVKPEAIIQIDEFSFNVGGLTGQPNLAFLYPDWIENLKADPTAFTLNSVNISEPKARFEWNKIRHHAPDTNWPPKGVLLTMNYKLPEITVQDLVEISTNSGVGRKNLFEDNFTELNDNWNIKISKSHERSSFNNEGKPAEIYTPNNTAVYGERKLPKGTRLVETSLNPGTDLSGFWGPGIALGWEDRIIKFNMIPGNESGGINRGPWKFSVFDGKRENTRAGGKDNVNLSTDWDLRIRIDGNFVYCEARPKGGAWKMYQAIDYGTNVPDPDFARIGKLGRNAEGIDFETPGKIVRLKFNRFAAYSAIDNSEITKLENTIEALSKLDLKVNYEIYDGIPLMSKWITIDNNSGKSLAVKNIISEFLGIADLDPYGGYNNRLDLRIKPNIHVETDYAFGGQKAQTANDHGVHWGSDQEYETQISWNQDILNTLRIYPEYGYNIDIPAGDTFTTIRTFELIHDSYEKERIGLGIRKMYRTVAPWVTESPMMFHITRSGWDEFTNGIDQAATVGYEMMNFSFGSGFNLEDISEKNLNQMKKYSDYAKSKGIRIGTYSLLSSRRISEKDDVVNPETGKTGGFARFGNAPCLGSEWGLDYHDKLYKVFGETGFLTLTHDGPYPGDQCASTVHPGHKNFEDSQFRQWQIASDFYKWARGKGVYLRTPDFYYMTGANQNAVGYRENNWSLPRRHQLIHTRQNIFDGTWENIPSMRWSFIPLAQYHGGGEAATIEPLNEHLDHYEMMLVSNLGMGLQSVLRGPRIYDTESTQKMVTRVVSWFKKYRDILESDIIHLRRADGRDIDYMMHVNPNLNEKGMLMVFNPTDETIKKKIKVSLYYTGLTENASVREKEGKSASYKLDREYSIEIEVEVLPNWYNWYVIE